MGDVTAQSLPEDQSFLVPELFQSFNISDFVSPLESSLGSPDSFLHSSTQLRQFQPLCTKTPCVKVNSRSSVIGHSKPVKTKLVKSTFERNAAFCKEKMLTPKHLLVGKRKKGKTNRR